MRIGIFAGYFPRRSETFVTDHVSELLARGCDVHVLAYGAESHAWDRLEPLREALHGRLWDQGLGKGKWYWMRTAVRVLTRNLARARRRFFRAIGVLVRSAGAIDLRFPFVYDRALDLGPVDILHCHFGPNGRLGAHLKRLGLTRKLVVTFHGYDLFRDHSEAKRRHLYAPVFRQADLLLAVSANGRDQLLALGAPPGKTRIHHVGIALDRFSYREREGSPGSITLATTARLIEKKGIGYAIEAIGQALTADPELQVRYHIAGDGPLRHELSTLARTCGVADRIHFHGPVPPPDVRAILERSDVFVLPSVTAADGDREGIPVALMEAMACGMPVIATEHSGIPELVDDGRSGRLVRERDVPALAESIRHLANRPDLWPTMGRTGRAKIERDHDLAKQMDSLLAGYRCILGGGDSTPGHDNSEK